MLNNQELQISYWEDSQDFIIEKFFNPNGKEWSAECAGT